MHTFAMYNVKWDSCVQCKFGSLLLFRLHVVGLHIGCKSGVDVLQAMGAMNKQMNLPALSNIMREFDRQNEKMEMTSEMMGDAVDDAFEVCMLCKQCVAAQSQCPFW